VLAFDSKKTSFLSGLPPSVFKPLCIWIYDKVHWKLLNGCRSLRVALRNREKYPYDFNQRLEQVQLQISPGESYLDLITAKSRWLWSWTAYEPNHGILIIGHRLSCNFMRILNYSHDNIPYVWGIPFTLLWNWLESVWMYWRWTLSIPATDTQRSCSSKVIESCCYL
jgi:hypothetical protein